jgi:hypothetical protein
VSADKLDEIAVRYAALSLKPGHSPVIEVRAALDEAVAEEQKALREIVMVARAGYYEDGPNGTIEGQMAGSILAVLAAREAK